MLRLRAGELEAHVVPDAGMLVASLRHRGEELLAQRDGLEAYRRTGRSFGIPLLHPWANRLGGFAYQIGARRVRFDADAPGLRLDEHGLPLHGLLAASPYWALREQAHDQLSAEFEYAAHEDLLGPFPFPHRLELELRLDPGGLDVSLTLVPTESDQAVPVAFGFHPWLTLPGARRAEWQITLPTRDHLALDRRRLPTGARKRKLSETFQLGTTSFDDACAGLAPHARFAVAAGGRRVTVTLLDGYPCAQLFAPAGQDTVCFEPMTAPPNALLTGEGLRSFSKPFCARFRIGVEAMGSRPPA